MTDAELVGSLLVCAALVFIGMIFLSRRRSLGRSAAVWAWLGLPALVVARVVGRDAVEVESQSRFGAR